MNNQKGSGVVWVLILVIVVIGAGVYLYTKSPSSPSAARTGTTERGAETETLSELQTSDEDSSAATAAISDLPAGYDSFTNLSDIYVDGDYIVIKTPGIPDHASPYYEGTQWESEKYEPYDGTNGGFHQNPNQIVEQDLVFRIPLNPELDPVHEPTPYGPIGVAINGVSLFNQFAAPGDSLEEEVDTFDQHNGHPTGNGTYHYHIDPVTLTSVGGGEGIVGVLLDGFFVYGPNENGAAITSADLDEYHGHFHATAEFPDGVYHYHVTDGDPYINGDGFYGTPGTVTGETTGNAGPPGGGTGGGPAGPPQGPGGQKPPPKR